MTDKAEIERRFWDALRSDMTLMLTCDGAEDGHSQPMTAQFDPQVPEGHGPIYFFTTRNNGLVKAMAAGARGTAHFAAKDHDLFACLHGNLVLDGDRLAIKRLWNPFVAAWFEKGEDDPELQLVRFDTESAEIWLNENSLFAGLKLLFGSDPKKDYRDKVAEVSLK